MFEERACGAAFRAAIGMQPYRCKQVKREMQGPAVSRPFGGM